VAKKFFHKNLERQLQVQDAYTWIGGTRLQRLIRGSLESEFVQFAHITEQKSGLCHTTSSPHSDAHLIVSTAYWGVMKSGTSPNFQHCYGLKEVMFKWILIHFHDSYCISKDGGRGRGKLRMLRMSIEFKVSNVQFATVQFWNHDLVSNNLFLWCILSSLSLQKR
jgi:hypothetical protein